MYFQNAVLTAFYLNIFYLITSKYFLRLFCNLQNTLCVLKILYTVKLSQNFVSALLSLPHCGQNNFTFVYCQLMLSTIFIIFRDYTEENLQTWAWLLMPNKLVISDAVSTTNHGSTWFTKSILHHTARFIIFRDYTEENLQTWAWLLMPNKLVISAQTEFNLCCVIGNIKSH